MIDGRLVGTWRLTSFQDVDVQDDLHDGPLGPEPRGLLLYSADGYMSVTMTAPGRPYLSYAGTWHTLGDVVVHGITLAPEAAWAGTEQRRDVSLDGDRLTLRGNRLVDTDRAAVLVWDRVRADRR